ncbi:MAG TPA: hypothetical protein VIC08_09345 [Cellvibrionaceae bacterium]
MKLDKSWLDKIDKLSLRERVIVLVAVLLVIYGLWFLLWFAGASSKRDLLEANSAAQVTEQSNLSQEIEVFNRVLSGDASSEKQRQLAALKATLAALDQDLARLSQGLVPARQLPEILRDMLAQTEGVVLVELQTSPVEKLVLGDAEDESATGVYKHTVNMTIRSDYFAVMHFIERLEGLSWRLYFDQLRYQVSEYPEAEVMLKVYTLSADRGSFGVEQ